MSAPKDWAEAAADLIVRRFETLNAEYLRMIGDRVKAIGRVSPTDLYRLERLRDVGADMDALKRRLARDTGLALTELEDLFRAAAKKAGKPYAGLMSTAEYRYNERAVALAAAQFQETGRELINLSRTTVCSETYQGLVDRAVSAVQLGAEDYNGAIRRALKETAWAGLRINEQGARQVRYQSGLTRRLDTAMRQNVLDGSRALFQHMMDEAGEAFGADGVELSAHRLCAEDHLPYQGRQFSREAFQQLQDTLPRRIGTWNCKHFTYPILLGISEPAYTPEELSQYRQHSGEMIAIYGKTQSRYKWSQEQRRLETAVRAQKDTAIAAKAAGDDVLRRECQSKINDYRKRYDQISGLTGLEPRVDRMAVSGYRRVKTAGELVSARVSGAVTTDGIVVSITSHVVERAAERGVSAQDITQSLTSPLKLGTIKVDTQGRPSRQYIGEHATVAVNPETGAAVSVWPTHTKTAKKLMKERDSK